MVQLENDVKTRQPTRPESSQSLAGTTRERSIQTDSTPSRFCPGRFCQATNGLGRPLLGVGASSRIHAPFKIVEGSPDQQLIDAKPVLSDSLESAFSLHDLSEASTRLTLSWSPPAYH